MMVLAKTLNQPAPRWPHYAYTHKEQDDKYRYDQRCKCHTDLLATALFFEHV